MKYCLIKDGVIFKYYVDKPKVILGAQDGVYLPIEDSQPTLNENQRVSGKTFDIQDDKVVVVYTIENVPQEEIVNKTIQEVTSKIDNFIQSKIDDYNKTNGTMFKDINAIAKYLIDTNYTHYPFCYALTMWNIQVWETARNIQSQVLGGSREMPVDITSELPLLSY